MPSSPSRDALLASLSALLAFTLCLAALRAAAARFPHAALLAAAAQATRARTMDPNAILAFVVGLFASVAVLLLITANKDKPELDPTEWRTFKLMEKHEYSSNTALYRFRLPSSRSILGLPIGQHISVQAECDGKKVQRSYTPTSSDDDKGFFDLLIKTYPNGNISKHVSTLKIGDSLQVRGPKGQMRYGPGLASHIGMIAGGTGITPMLQIIRAAMKDPKDTTKIDLIYANVKEEDILCRKELDELAAKHDKFDVHYFLNEPPQGWKGGEGFVSKEKIEEVFVGPKDDAKVLLCGPPPMINAMKKHLEELKYQKPNSVSKLPDQVFCF